MPNNYQFAILPRFLFLFGPPGAGKGTQSEALQKLFPMYKHVGISGLIKKFVEENISNSSNSDYQERAKRMQEIMSRGDTVGTEDGQLAVLSALQNYAKNDEFIIVDGFFRSTDQATWGSNFLIENHVSSTLIHLHITLDTAIKRNTTRWYVGDTMYIGKEAADKHATAENQPYQRQDDNKQTITKRYKEQYDNIWSKILMTYQQKTKSPIFVIDAEQSIEDVNQSILKALQSYPRDIN